MILLFSDLEGFAGCVTLLNEFFLLVDEGIGIRKGIELSSGVSILADWLEFEIGVFEEEIFDEFGIEILIDISLLMVGTILKCFRIFLRHEVGVSIVLRIEHSVLDEILHTGFQMHASPPSIVHLHNQLNIISPLLFYI